ncbi:cilia- and flagella-associated protein 69-like [Nematolebias whitei]|uniref:cilia- and flagella-associated protein 69-like n=1 Tax=Nematolebias whitei TaxID=451745 RepID=UPI00189C53CA|nr:cilia- and flagella-associated protein 69-like [Nematolebias whitei]
MDSGHFIHRTNSDIPKISLRAALKTQDFQEVKSLDLGKVIRLLEDPLTTNLKERHLFVLKKLLKRNQNGFLLRELTDLSRILNICAEKTTDHHEYAAVLCEALKICSLPFVKERASDELNFTQAVTEFLSNMARLMRVSHEEVRLRLVESVKSFFSSAVQIKEPEGLQHVSPGFRLQQLDHSDVPRTLLLSMAAVQNQPAVRLQLLQTLQILSSSSDRSCASILQERGAETICLHMNEPDPSGQVLLCSAEILWNLLEGGSTEEVIAQLSSMECVLSLKETFLFLLENSSQRSDLRPRNYLLVITCFVAERSSSLLVESFFAKELLSFFKCKTEHFSSSAHKLTFSDEDVKMKKLLLSLLVVLCRDGAALQLYREEQVMMFLLKLVKLPLVSAERQPGPSQQEELQLQALAALSSIAPFLLADYMSCQGNNCLLLLLDLCVGADVAASSSTGGGGGGGGTKAQMRRCIRTLRSVTSLGDPSVNQDLCDQGATRQLLGILIQLEASSDEEDVLSVEMMSDVQLVLSALCETDTHTKDLFGSDGAQMVVNFLKKGSENFYSGLGHNKLILSTVDCVWSCIVGCFSTEFYFLVKNGVSLLLDLLRTGPRCVCSIVLSALLGLCDNPDSRPQILSWRDADGLTAPSFLLQLWREEEEELGVLRTQHGGIQDPRKPLLTRFHRDAGGSSLPVDTPSATVLEISENLRAKIYFILCSLGFLELPGLSAEEYVTLSIVKRYLDFKVGEVWDEVRRDLSLDGVRPVSPDEDALSSVCGMSEDTARRTAMEQTIILELQQEEELSEELLLYQEMKSHWKQQELTDTSWNDYVSRTSHYETLKERKAQRERHAESSRPERKDDRPDKGFIGRILTVENTGALGPTGLKVTLSGAPIRTDPTTQNLRFSSSTEDEQPEPGMIFRLGRLTPGYFCLLQRQLSGEVRVQQYCSIMEPVAMTMAAVGMGFSAYSAKKMLENPGRDL